MSRTFGSRRQPRYISSGSGAMLSSYGRRGSGRSWSRRRSSFPRPLLLFLVLCAALAALIWGWFKPVHLRAESAPVDATLTLSNGASATGELDIPKLKPGRYRLTAIRKGFATRTVDVDVARFKGTDCRVTLKPLPQAVSISAVPASALIAVTDASGKKVASAEGRLKTSLPSGRFVLRVTASGCNEYERELFVDEPETISLRLDPKGQLVSSLSLSACSGAPKAVALTPDGTQAWTTILNGPPSVEVFDPATGVLLGEVDLGKHGAVEIVFSRDGKRAYASQMETARVFEIDVRRRKVLRSFDTESAWTKAVALSHDGMTLFAANWSGDDVSEIDLASGRLVRRIPVADTPRGLWLTKDGKTLWVASFETGDLEKVDLATGKVKRVFTSYGALRHLVADESRGKLFASDMAKDCVWVTDMKTGKTKKFVKVDHKPNTIDLSDDGRVLFVSCRGENNSVSYYLPGPEWGSILLFDAKSGKPLDAIVGGNQCTALDVSDDGGTLVFSDFLDDRLRSYQVPGFNVLAQGGGGRFAAHKEELEK